MTLRFGKGVRRRAAAICAAGSLVILAVIWVPWFVYNHVPDVDVQKTAIDEGRSVPGDAVLEELGQRDVGISLSWSTEHDLLAAADQLLDGKINLPGYEPTTFHSPFDAADMAAGSGKWQLFEHGFGVPRVLLSAYEATGRREFLDAAAAYVVAYDTYEGSGWQLGGYIWVDDWKEFVRNDHAMSARVAVLTEFWRVYRHSTGYSPNVAEAVFRMASRYAYMLADPARFTVATNHGVMQNLAACQLQAAFPTLPDVANLCPLAVERFGEQIRFWINDEGFILEHSPGYQGYDLEVIGQLFRAMTLAGVSIPVPWQQKYVAAQGTFEEFRRPDGSLPMFGDTAGIEKVDPAVVTFDDRGHASVLGPREWSASKETTLAPIAGYCVWWNGLSVWPDATKMSQTTIAWSYFPRMAHKHADEMSVDLWAAGTSWWSNVGYWPYDDPGRVTAESWEGANAPHLVGEPANSPRKSQLRYHGRSRDLAAIDLERDGPGTYRARRQVIHVEPGLWLVLDSSAGVEAGTTRVIWTVSPPIRLTVAGADGAYELSDGSTGRSLLAFFNGSPGSVRRVVEGSLSPFGGWSARGRVVQPTPAVVVEQPANDSWALASWSLVEQAGDDAALTGPPIMAWNGAENWVVRVPTKAGPATLQRLRDRLELHRPEGNVIALELNPGPDISEPWRTQQADLASAAARYGVPLMSGHYRLKVTVVLIASLLLCISAFLFVAGYRASWRRSIGIGLGVAWLILCYYLIVLRIPLV